MNSITIDGKIEYGPAYRWTDEPPTCELIINVDDQLFNVHIEGELMNTLSAYHNGIIRIRGELQRINIPDGSKIVIVAKQIEKL